MVAVKLTTSARGLSRDGRTSARAQEAHVTSCQTRHEPVREQSVVTGPKQVTAHAEEIQHEAVDCEKAWRVRGGSEPAHLSVALAAA